MDASLGLVEGDVDDDGGGELVSVEVGGALLDGGGALLLETGGGEGDVDDGVGDPVALVDDVGAEDVLGCGAADVLVAPTPLV